MAQLAQHKRAINNRHENYSIYVKKSARLRSKQSSTYRTALYIYIYAPSIRSSLQSVRSSRSHAHIPRRPELVVPWAVNRNTQSAVRCVGTMSWEQGHERGDKLEINEAVGKLLQSFNYDTIVAQPTKYVNNPSIPC